MKVVKSQVLLYMYESLNTKKEIDPEFVKGKFELTNKTFLRYIQEIRAYYSNMYKNEKIIYSKQYKLYFLVQENKEVSA